MKEYFKIMWFVLVGIFSIFALVFILNALDLVNVSLFSPKLEKVRYDTFKQSQSYNDGMLRDLQNLKMEYASANPDAKIALKYVILQRFSVYDVNRLPPDLSSFYYSIQGK
jgi:hypothetical protein